MFQLRQKSEKFGVTSWVVGSLLHTAIAFFPILAVRDAYFGSASPAPLPAIALAPGLFAAYLIVVAPLLQFLLRRLRNASVAYILWAALVCAIAWGLPFVSHILAGWPSPLTPDHTNFMLSSAAIVCLVTFIMGRVT